MKRKTRESTGSAASGTPDKASLSPQIPTRNANSRSGAGPYKIGHSAENKGSVALGTLVMDVPWPQIPTGNSNRGSGAGAYNIGNDAGSSKADEGKGAKVNYRSQAGEPKVPKDGNDNRGPGAGAVNYGVGAGAEMVKDGAEVNYTRSGAGPDKIGHSAKNKGSVALVIPATAHQLPPIPTGNINMGSGAGAYNIGNAAGSSEAEGKRTKVNYGSQAGEPKVTKGGNDNRVAGAGAVNYGVGAGAEKVKDGEEVNYTRSGAGPDKIGHYAKNKGSVPLVIPGTAHQLPPIPTGNINVGPGAGAYNIGNAAGSLEAEGKRAKVNYRSQAGEPKVPKGGNDNRGAGAGAVNYGVGAGAEKVKDGAEVNYT